MAGAAAATLLNRRGQTVEGLQRNLDDGIACEAALAHMLVLNGVRFAYDWQQIGRPDTIDFRVGEPLEGWSVKSSRMNEAVVCAAQMQHPAEWYVFYGWCRAGRPDPLGICTYDEFHSRAGLIREGERLVSGKRYVAYYDLYVLRRCHLLDLKEHVADLAPP